MSDSTVNFPDGSKVNGDYRYADNRPIYAGAYFRNLAFHPTQGISLIGTPIIFTIRKHRHSKTYSDLNRYKYTRATGFTHSDYYTNTNPVKPIATSKLIDPRALGLKPSSPQDIAFFKVNPYQYFRQGDLSTLGEPYLILPTVPQELSYKPNSTFSAIKIQGRNNPLYHYGGSEDTLRFQIDWFMGAKGNKDLVINNCRKVEALSKADGYSPPPIVYLAWGKNPLFYNSLWLVASAQYKMKNFSNNILGKNVHRDVLSPIYATQTVILKRVTGHSLTHREIINHPTSF